MPPLVRHEVDDRVGREHVELGGVHVVRAGHGAGEVDHRALQAQAEAQVRHAALPRVPGGEDLALDPAVAEATGHEDRRGADKRLVDGLGGERLRVNPAHLHVHSVRPARVLERFGDREVRVRELDVLPDEGDLQLGLVALDQLLG